MRSAALALLLAGHAMAGLAGDAKYVTLSPIAVTKVHPGETVTLSVRFKVDTGLHVQANPASAKNLIPTTVTFEPSAGLEIGAPSYPTSKSFRLKGSETDIATYDGEVEIRLPVTASSKTKPGKRKLKGKLRYQACEETSCFFPMSLPLEASILILVQK
jgi:DsbC/DsbD-like thiol-disulfide interchange protein